MSDVPEWIKRAAERLKDGVIYYNEIIYYDADQVAEIILDEYRSRDSGEERRAAAEAVAQRDAAVSALIGILGKRDKEQREFKGVSADAKVMIGPVTVATYRAGHAAIHAADARGEGEGK